MESSNEEGEDVFSIVCGDLGLGESTRSRNYLEMEQLRMLEQSCSQRASPANSKASLVLHQDFHDHQMSLTQLATPGLGNGFSSVSDPLLYDYKDMALSCHSSISGCISEYGAVTPVSDLEQQPFPRYADVPYGTSLRQHKQLFEQEVENLRRQHLDSSQVFHDTESTDKEKDPKKTKGKFFSLRSVQVLILKRNNSLSHNCRNWMKSVQ